MDFEPFFRREHGRIVAVLCVAWLDRPTVEDAVQEAMARALARWRRVGAMEFPERWVYVTAVNLLRRAATRRGDPPMDLEQADASESVAAAVVVDAAVRALPARQRQAIVLYYLADMSVADVARAMGCAEGTVKASLHQGRASLHAALGEERVNADR